MKNLNRFAPGLLALVPMLALGQTLTPSQDAYYVPGNSSNFGTAATVTVGSSASIGLVQFDLSSLPASVTAGQVQKATLTLFLDHVGASGSINIDTVSASTTWGELAVNGSTPPSTGSPVATGVAATTAFSFISVDVTAAVQGWITSPSSNNGFMLLPNTGSSLQFDSKENTNTSHPATLTIVLASVGATGAAGVAGATGPAGATGAASNVAGPAGATGVAGATGIAGPTGPAGPTGVAGATGVAGSTGSAGATGVAGATGGAGATGSAGAAGAAGATGVGVAGATGATGATGPAGSGGTGENPTSIPLTISGHHTSINSTVFYYSPTSAVAGGTSGLISDATVVVPATCTPSITIWSHVPVAETWQISSVTPSAAGDAWSISSVVASCDTAAASGNTPQICHSSNGTPLAAGTVLTLGLTVQPNGAYGFVTAFSCQ